MWVITLFFQLVELRFAIGVHTTPLLSVILKKNENVDTTGACSYQTFSVLLLDLDWPSLVSFVQYSNSISPPNPSSIPFLPLPKPAPPSHLYIPGDKTFPEEST